ncbi:Pectin lyase fold/virulence factor [Pseudocohnilembus persalinus]|uniref:Pectin lyase fold/virulence factor n=1 Tax=Pseudocohnilembus persalinus TaxID=266149 RepID=A0A0V0QSE8_PSEPJ|nr:Pectin lyase fold/virulence factor [Pseudocohnilembus persalinus]|eukprot:KRX04928.1 Pectin lyase fold/virulence factor [Pseudocohnilembus persalinus]
MKLKQREQEKKQEKIKGINGWDNELSESDYEGDNSSDQEQMFAKKKKNKKPYINQERMKNIQESEPSLNQDITLQEAMDDSNQQDSKCQSEQQKERSNHRQQKNSSDYSQYSNQNKSSDQQNTHQEQQSHQQNYRKTSYNKSENQRQISNENTGERKNSYNRNRQQYQKNSKNNYERKNYNNDRNYNQENDDEAINDYENEFDELERKNNQRHPQQGQRSHESHNKNPHYNNNQQQQQNYKKQYNNSKGNYRRSSNEQNKYQKDRNFNNNGRYIKNYNNNEDEDENQKGYNQGSRQNQNQNKKPNNYRNNYERDYNNDRKRDFQQSNVKYVQSNYQYSLDYSNINYLIPCNQETKQIITDNSVDLGQPFKQDNSYIDINSIECSFYTLNQNYTFDVYLVYFDEQTDFVCDLQLFNFYGSFCDDSILFNILFTTLQVSSSDYSSLVVGKDDMDRNLILDENFNFYLQDIQQVKAYNLKFYQSTLLSIYFHTMDNIYFEKMQFVNITDAVSSFVQIYGAQDLYLKNVLFENNYQIESKATRTFLKIQDINNFTVEEGQVLNNNGAGGGIFSIKQVSNQITFDQLQVINCQSIFQGGAFYIYDAEDIKISNSDFNNNTLEINEQLEVFQKLSEQNSISSINSLESLDFNSNGGAIFLQQIQSIKISDSTFQNNYAPYKGGAISIKDNFNLTVDNCNFDNNTNYFYSSLDRAKKIYSEVVLSQGGSIYYYQKDNEFQLQNQNYNIYVNITNTKFKNGISSSGAGMMILNSLQNQNKQQQIILKLDNLNFSNNLADLGPSLRILGQFSNIQDDFYKKFPDIVYNGNEGQLDDTNVYFNYYYNEYPPYLDDQIYDYNVCLKGFYQNDRKQVQCDTCPEFCDCPGGYANFYPLEGYWRKDSLSELIFQCFLDNEGHQLCQGNDICHEGYQGIKCQNCDLKDGFRKGTNEICQKCSEGGKKGWYLFFVFIMILLIIGIFIYMVNLRTRALIIQKILRTLFDYSINELSNVSGIIKIFIVYQSFNVILTTDTNYITRSDHEFKSFFGNPQKIMMKAISCFIEIQSQDDYQKVVNLSFIYTQLIFLGITLSIFVYEISLYFFGIIKEKSTLLAYLFNSALIIQFYFHPGNFFYSIRFLLCDDTGGVTYTVADSNINCSGEYFRRSVMPFHLLFLLVVGFIAPVSYGLIVINSQKEIFRSYDTQISTVLLVIDRILTIGYLLYTVYLILKDQEQFWLIQLQKLPFVGKFYKKKLKNMMKAKMIWKGIRKSLNKTSRQHKNRNDLSQYKHDFLYNIKKYFNPSIQIIKIQNLNKKNKLSILQHHEKQIPNSSSMMPQASINNKNLSQSFLPHSISPQQIKFNSNPALLGFSAINLINSELKQSRFTDEKEPNSGNNTSMKIIQQKTIERKNTDDQNKSIIKQSQAVNFNQNSSYHITEEIDSSSQSDQRFMEFNAINNQSKSFIRQCNGDDNQEVQFSVFQDQINSKVYLKNQNDDPEHNKKFQTYDFENYNNNYRDEVLSQNQQDTTNIQNDSSQQIQQKQQNENNIINLSENKTKVKNNNDLYLRPSKKSQYGQILANGSDQNKKSEENTLIIQKNQSNNDDNSQKINQNDQNSKINQFLNPLKQVADPKIGQDQNGDKNKTNILGEENKKQSRANMFKNMLTKTKVYIPEKYSAIPHYQKIEKKDPHDYQLRGKEELMQEWETNPPNNINITFIFQQYNDAAYEVSDRNRRVSCDFDIGSLGLSKLQKDRMKILLGPRYKGKDQVRISVEQYPEMEQNYVKLTDMLKQAYWESKRAPLNKY